MTTNSRQGKCPPVTPERVPLDRIRVDGGTQVRAELDQDTIREYGEAYKAGVQLPPVDLYSDGSYLWMADGFHRFGGAKLAQLESLEAVIHEGTQRDALLFAVGSNHTHGLRRTLADKSKAVGLLLADPEWSRASDRWIADACRVSHPFVASVRERLATEAATHQHQSKRPTGNASSSTRGARKGRDGKTRKRRAQGERQPGDEEKAAKAPALCGRCERIGKAACPKCIESGAKPKAKKAGGAIFDWPAFDQAYRSLMQQVARLGQVYEQPDAVESVRDDLIRWRHAVRSAYESITKQKPPPEVHEKGAA
jgi:hypothetical protein